jgi:hypothetical protein
LPLLCQLRKSFGADHGWFVILFFSCKFGEVSNRWCNAQLVVERPDAVEFSRLLNL